MVTELTQKQNLYQQAFQSLQESPGVKNSSWLERLRENAMDRFLELGFPSVKEEEWKYTNVVAIARSHFRPTVSSELTPRSNAGVKQLASVPEAGSSQLVFVDGVFRNDLSSFTALPEQVVAIDLSRAIADERYSDIVRTHLARQADYVVNGFTALNTAFINHGALVFIPKNVTVEAPIHLLFIAESERVSNFPRVIIFV